MSLEGTLFGQANTYFRQTTAMSSDDKLSTIIKLVAISIAAGVTEEMLP
jgi:hypothetical protein